MLRESTKISIFFVLSLMIAATNLFAGDFTKFSEFWSPQTNSTWTNSFTDNLDVGESKEVTIKANEPYNYTHIYLQKDKKYKFTVGSPEWNNGKKETDAGGYVATDPYSFTRRYSAYKTMALVGAVYSDDNNPYAVINASFLIGLGRAGYTAPKSGYLVAFANDCMPCYADNSRVVTLTVKRVE